MGSIDNQNHTQDSAEDNKTGPETPSNDANLTSTPRKPPMVPRNFSPPSPSSPQEHSQSFSSGLRCARGSAANEILSPETSPIAQIVKEPTTANELFRLLANPPRASEKRIGWSDSASTSFDLSSTPASATDGKKANYGRVDISGKPRTSSSRKSNSSGGQNFLMNRESEKYLAELHKCIERVQGILSLLKLQEGHR